MNEMQEQPGRDSGAGTVTGGPPQKWDYQSLTAFRGIAALLVVFYHFSGGFMPGLSPEHVTYFVDRSYLWVDFFFLLSGFVMAHVYRERFSERIGGPAYRGFLVARLARIYPLHLALLAAFVALEVLRSLALQDGLIEARLPPFEGPKSLSALLVSLGLLQSTGIESALAWNWPSWSIASEWFAYLLFPVLVLAGARMGRRAGLLSAAACLLGLVLLSKDGGAQLDRTADFGVLRCLCEFSLGMLVEAALQRLLRAGDRLRWLARGTTSVGLLALIVLGMHLGWDAIAFPPLMAAFLLCLALNDRREGRFARALSGRMLLWLGTISYAIYLCHALVLEAAELAGKVLVGHKPGVGLDPAQSLIAIAIAYALILPLAHVLHRGIERPAQSAVKSSRLARRFIHGPAATGTRPATQG
ncbi:acyltransferase [Pseudooceanicola sp. CBS1P-1]|uniref:Acyltransferase family protein n=1 Tax=Pseudooceanicola albus TaxID=2692189 RepID=A0A6L7FYK9_9RHOB|nr:MULTISPECIES: acyltransferase [Pseudooceanicola]MBT9382329.1 acyltransferase [Pseudooceanicola endophyticus]MXN16871.1 acyltransferase family protein [Pseudooceanicola albus]